MRAASPAVMGPWGAGPEISFCAARSSKFQNELKRCLLGSREPHAPVPSPPQLHPLFRGELQVLLGVRAGWSSLPYFSTTLAQISRLRGHWESLRKLFSLLSGQQVKIGYLQVLVPISKFPVPNDFFPTKGPILGEAPLLLTAGIWSFSTSQDPAGSLGEGAPVAPPR